MASKKSLNAGNLEARGEVVLNRKAFEKLNAEQEANGAERPGFLARAWRRWRSVRPPRRLKFTREGKFFVGITLGVGFAAINTANNLLYLLLGMLLDQQVTMEWAFGAPLLLSCSTLY